MPRPCRRVARWRSSTCVAPGFNAVSQASESIDGATRIKLEHSRSCHFVRPSPGSPVRWQRERPPMLTRKQHELLSFIDAHLKQPGVPPSFGEMKEALQLRSTSGIHRLISALEERGFLRRHHHRARALEVMRLPENAPKSASKTDSGFTPNVIRGDFS